MNNLDSATNSTGVALTTAVDSSIAFTPWKKRKEKAGTGEGSQTE